MIRRRLALLALALCLMPPSMPSLAAGSWVANQAGPRVALADATTRSSPLSAPTRQARGQRITSVSWRFSLPDTEHSRVTAKLCHPVRCVTLASERGSTEALAGLDADAPLTFQFRLARPGPAVQTQGLQVIVNYRES
ncbi:MAG: flagellar protein FlhE [Halomonas sp.]